MTEEEIVQTIRNNFDDQVVSALPKFKQYTILRTSMG